MARWNHPRRSGHFLQDRAYTAADSRAVAQLSDLYGQYPASVVGAGQITYWMHEMLSIAADLYTPALLALFVFSAITHYKQGNRGHVGSCCSLLLLLIALSYLLMALDQHWLWYQRYFLDYSTHTAIALSLALSLYLLSGSAAWLAASLACYLSVMVILGYHTIADIIATLALLIPLMAAMYFFIRRTSLADHS